MIFSTNASGWWTCPEEMYTMSETAFQTASRLRPCRSYLEGSARRQPGNNVFIVVLLRLLQHFMELPRKLLGNGVRDPSQDGLLSVDVFVIVSHSLQLSAKMNEAKSADVQVFGGGT